MQKLTISQYLKRPDAYPVSAQTVRRYIDKGILKGEKIKAGHKVTYYVHIDDTSETSLILQMAQG